MYVDPGTGQISQGDLFDDCPLVGLEPHSAGLAPEVVTWSRPVIVVTQACDVAQVKTNHIVVAVVHDAQTLVDEGILKASLIRDRIRRHQVFGWYFLPGSNSPRVAESVVDLRNIHTVARGILDGLIANGGRLARLDTPYREHMNQHFAQTYARIGLPEPYETTKE